MQKESLISIIPLELKCIRLKKLSESKINLGLRVFNKCRDEHFSMIMGSVVQMSMIKPICTKINLGTQSVGS